MALPILFILFSVAAKAEYRAFLLRITGPQGERLVKSNHDPEQYVGYFPIQQNEQIVYVDTWMCKGRTSDFRQICPSPREPDGTLAQRAPAAAPGPLTDPTANVQPVVAPVQPLPPTVNP